MTQSSTADKAPHFDDKAFIGVFEDRIQHHLDSNCIYLLITLCHFGVSDKFYEMQLNNLRMSLPLPVNNLIIL